MGYRGTMVMDLPGSQPAYGFQASRSIDLPTTTNPTLILLEPGMYYLTQQQVPLWNATPPNNSHKMRFLHTGIGAFGAGNPTPNFNRWGWDSYGGPLIVLSNTWVEVTLDPAILLPEVMWLPMPPYSMPAARYPLRAYADPGEYFGFTSSGPWSVFDTVTRLTVASGVYPTQWDAFLNGTVNRWELRQMAEAVLIGPT